MLKAENLTIAYGNTEVVHQVNFHIEKGEIVTVLGANGAGKSTILNTIVGQHRAKSGTVTYKDEDISKVAASKIVRKGISLVPEGRQIFPAHTVTENLQLGAYTVSDHKKIHDNMEKMFEQYPRLRERRNQMGGTLSGGEQQMLAIARALMTDPEFLILDEPSLGLAPIIVAEVFELLQKISEEGVTILLVEQMANSALKISDRAYVLETGNIVLDGKASDVVNDETVIKAYLGSI
jgi:branched-chain amino acid transport system ATP-binding protein